MYVEVFSIIEYAREENKKNHILLLCPTLYLVTSTVLELFLLLCSLFCIQIIQLVIKTIKGQKKR